MNDFFYKLAYGLGYPAFGTSSSPILLHRDRVCRPGPYILAPNHLSPYDIPCLMLAAGRVLDFVSITEMFRKPFVGWFFGKMGAFPLDRWKPDAPAVRTMLRRLQDGRVLVMFPEAGIRSSRNSVLSGGPLKPGVLRIAALAKVPIVPCVLLGTAAYRRVDSWWPVRGTVWGANFGPALSPPVTAQALRDTYHHLHIELQDACRGRGRQWTVQDFPDGPEFARR